MAATPERRSDVRAALAHASDYLRGIDRSTLDRHDPEVERIILAVGQIFKAVKALADETDTHAALQES